MGVIAKSAIKAFLNRRLDNYSWIKKSSRRDLISYLSEMPYDIKFKTKPFTHQLACTILGLELNEFMYLLDMGTGKTKINLDVVETRMRAGEIKKTLALVPSPINMVGWEDEVLLHTDLKPVALEGGKDEKLHLLDSDGDIFLLNYAGLQTLVTETVKKKKKKKGNERVIVKKELSDLASQFDCVIFDEIHGSKNTQSLTYRICNQLSKETVYRYGLTGTPFGRNPEDFWAEFFLVDRGATLGQTLGLYRAAMFTEKQNWYSGYPDYEFDNKNRRKLARVLKHRSIRYADWECNDLPAVVYNKVYVNFDHTAHEYYKNIIKTIIDIDETAIEKENNFVKLRQISSGFVKLVDDDGNATIIDFPDNPKIDALRELLLSVPENRKIVIFYEFIKSGDLIENLLKELKIGHVRLDGTVKGKDKGKKALHKFNKDPKCRVFSANSKSGGQGLNLQIANYEIFYESPVSPIVRRQAEKRCHRTGQKRKTFIYSIIVKHSVEEKIEEFIKEGKDLFDCLVDSGVSSTKKLLKSFML